MKTLKNLALAAVMFATAAAAQAQWVSGYYRSTGTYVQPYYRPPCDQGYRVYVTPPPAYSPTTSYTYGTYGSSGYGSSYSAPVTVYGSSTQIGGTTFHNYSSSDGGYLSGTTTTIGNSSFTTLYGR